MFREYLLLYRERNMRRALLDLFDVLSTPPEERDEYMDAELAAFPYVNGGLFDGEKIKVPPFTPDIIDLLIHQASEQFDWSAISPTIFGAVFESTMNPATRRAGGLHYTSVENIHKVIDPLFLDGLKEELAAAKAERTARNRRARLLAFQERIAGLKFLDPACGSGNFLTETYLSLRRLENEAVKELSGEETVLGFEGEHSPIKVAISQFHGIEINDFAVSVAKAALWIAESQAMQETENIVHRELDFLPLKSYGNIVEGNALRMDWEDVIPKAECRYIMGNPPFVGKGFQTKEQKSDMSEIFQGIKGYGNLDYVTCWYKKATEYMQDTEIQTAFVSTNSICQGIAVPPLWKYLFERGIKINFAHRTFKWNSESYYKAAVYCVIIGFSFLEMSPKFYDGNHPISVQNINAYLLDAPNIIVEGRDKAMYDVPPMIVGSCPADGGGFIISDVDFEKFIKKEPLAKKFIHPYIGSEELINGKMRYCLWLKDCTPTELDKMPHVLERVQSVKTFRESSKKEQTRRRAETPTLFTEDRYVERPSIFMPQVSSSNDITTDIYTDGTSTLWLVYAGRLNFASDEQLQNLKVTRDDILTSSEEALFVADLTQSAAEAAKSAEAGKSIISSEMTKTIKEAEGENEAIESTAVFIANASFITDYKVEQLSQTYPISYLANNKDFMLNSIASLTKKENTLKIRKDMSSSTYTATEEQHRVVLAIIFIVPLLIIAAGIVVWNLRRRKR